MLQRDLVQKRVYGCRFRVIGPAFIPRLCIPNHLLLLCLCLCGGRCGPAFWVRSSQQDLARRLKRCLLFHCLGSFRAVLVHISDKFEGCSFFSAHLHFQCRKLQVSNQAFRGSRWAMPASGPSERLALPSSLSWFGALVRAKC